MKSRKLILYKTMFEKDHPIEIDLYWMPNGHIKCEDDQKYWCKHIQGAISECLDAESLWEELATTFDASVDIEVPMIPSSNLWARVTLEDAGQKYLCRKVIWDNATIPWLTDHLAAGPIAHPNGPNFIGFLLPGEGRMIIRNMLFDWFKGNVIQAEMTCTSSSHGYKEQIAWTGAMKDEQGRWREFWSVYTTGFCLACTTSISEWSDDLIPESDKKASVW